jgi:hypothetical protein
VGNNKARFRKNTIKPNKMKTYDRQSGRRSFWTSSGMRTFPFRWHWAA